MPVSRIYCGHTFFFKFHKELSFSFLFFLFFWGGEVCIKAKQACFVLLVLQRLYKGQGSWLNPYFLQRFRWRVFSKLAFYPQFYEG